MGKIRAWLLSILKCKHKNMEYQPIGGKGCVYNSCADCTGECSIPVYLIRCKDCGRTWLIREDEVIGFLLPRAEMPPK